MNSRDLAKQGVIKAITKLHAQWRAATDRKAGQAAVGKKSRLLFRDFLSRRDEQLYAILLREPGLCEELPTEVQRALRPPKGRKIGPAVLRKYSALLTQRFMADGGRGTLGEFLESVAQRCATENELKAWLSIKV